MRPHRLPPDTADTGPPKEKRGLGTAPKTAELLTAYGLSSRLQAADLQKIDCACAAAWKKEAARLFREFWRTGNRKHLRAFTRHVVAMRTHEARATR
jgi:hypothetical protein